MGNISLLLEEENRRKLEEVQREIKFEYCIVNKLFSDEMDIYKGKNNRFINWTRVENILDFIVSLKLTPLIKTDKVEKYIIEDFKNHFTSIFGEKLEEWLKINIDDLDPYFPKKKISLKQDSLFMLPYIIDNYLSLNKRLVLNMIDEITKNTLLDNETFFGGNGIITSNYLKKPSYYVYMLLSLLGSEILYRGEGYIATRSEKGYQILLYNPMEIDENSIYGQGEIKKIKERKISLNLLNMEGDYQISKYEISREFGSVYDKWVSLGRPERLDNEHWNLLEEFVHPNVSFHYGEKSIVYNIISLIKPYGAILYLLDRVSNEEN